MSDNSQGNFDQELLARLQDPAKRLELWQRMTKVSPHNSFTPRGTFPGTLAPHLTPSGTAQGAGPQQPFQPSCFPLMWWPPFPPFFPPQHVDNHPNADTVSPNASRQDMVSPYAAQQDTVSPNNNSTSADQRAEEDDEVESERASQSQDDDRVVIHDEESNTMFAEFNPEIEQTNSWDPPKQMSAYLEKHFNKNLKGEEVEAILEDYPMPNCPAIEVPRLDEEVKKQLRSKGRDPHFGQEKTLFGIQGELLKVGGPLTCLWADMINPDVEPDKEKIALLVQRALVLLGSASHSITLERRKIAWARINPSLKSLAMEQYEGRKDNLFGPGFLEKASKKLESDKALAKVTAPGNPRKRNHPDDSSDLRRFLSNGAPSKNGGKGFQRQTKPYKPQQQKYYKGNQWNKKQRRT